MHFMTPYQTPMSSPPALAPYARTLRLPALGFSVFLYDSDPSAARSAEPLLLLHGLGDEADTWRLVFPALAEPRRVLALDWPGFGRSELPAPVPAAAVPFFLGVLGELLEVLALPRLALAGHSMGAMLAQAFALEQPQRVSRLILLSGGMLAAAQKLDPLLLAFLVPGLGEWLYTRLRRDPQAAYRTLQPFYANLAGLPEAEREFLFARVNQRVWSDRQRRAYFFALRGLARWLPAQQRTLPQRLAGWQMPTTILWGERDRVNPPANGKALAELLPSARLVIVPGGGHNLPQEQPAPVIQALAG